MEHSARKKRQPPRSASNKENVCEEEQRVPQASTKDARERIAEQQLKDISDIDWRKVEAGWQQQPPESWDELSGWNQPPPPTAFLRQRTNSIRLCSNALKPRSAGSSRPRLPAKQPAACEESSSKVNYRTSTLETIGDDEVFVCKPVATEPAEQTDSSRDCNMLFEPKHLSTVVASISSAKLKSQDQPNKLYEIIKSIEVENGKLLRKLFKEKCIYREPTEPNRRQSLKSAGRPSSSVRRQRSKDGFKTGEAPASRPDDILGFVLCSQKGIIPSAAKQVQSDMRSIRRELFSADNDSIFYPCANAANRFTLRAKIAASSMSRKK